MADTEKTTRDQESQRKDPRPDSLALEQALNEHYKDFQGYLIRRVGDRTTAEDILQNFCMRVMKNKTQLRDKNSAIGWLYTVLRSVLMDHFRKETTRKRSDARYAQEQIVLETDRVAPVADDNICNCLRGLLPDLRPEYADLLSRIDFLEEPREKVGTDMAISPENLRVRLHRARLAIGVALKQHCGECCETEYRDCFCERGCTYPEAVLSTGGLADQ